MSAFTLDPNGSGNYDQWTNVGGATKLASVSDAVDGNFIYNPAGLNRSQSFTMDNLPAEAVGVEGDVTHHSRDGRSGAGAGNHKRFFRYGADSLATQYACPASWTNGSNTFAQAPGAVPWTVAILNATEIGIYNDGSGGSNGYCTKLYATGNYTPAGGGFAWLLVSVVPFLLGANVLLTDMPAIAREVAARRHPDGGARITLLPAEYQHAWQELRDHPHRVFFLPEAKNA